MQKPSTDRPRGEKILPLPLQQMREKNTGQNVAQQPVSRRGMILGKDGEPIPLQVDTRATVWRPRWRWVGKLLGHQVPVGQEPAVQDLLHRVYLAQGAPQATQGDPAPAQQVSSVKKAAVVVEEKAAATDKEPSQKEPAPAPKKESVKEWAWPLLVVCLGLLLVFAMGTLLGYALATGHVPNHLLAAIIEAPAGDLLLLLGGFACLVQAHEESRWRMLWRMSGGILLAAFVWSLTGAFL